jgi:hypothetical protein
MVLGFQHTARDVITHIVADGDTVTVRLRAYETTGPVQIYVGTYTVNGDLIASGQSTLITTRPAG